MPCNQTNTTSRRGTDDNPLNPLSPLISTGSSLLAEYRRRRIPYEQKRIHPRDLDTHLDNGWLLQRLGKRVSRVKRPKRHDKGLEDRVWCLLHSMGYEILSGDNFSISFRRSDNSTGKKQVDVYAEDDETVLIIECKSKLERGRRSLQKDIQETISLQTYFRNTIFKRFSTKSRPKIVWIYVTQNIVWSPADLDRANDGDIRVITENELQYFETFIKHLGPGGRYQILAQFLGGQKIPSLSDITLPAIRGKIGGNVFYSFVTTPRHLLKIAFINHQALQYPDGRPAYQRMISASRIKEIGKFIQAGGFFPTNILVNFTNSPRFDLISNEQNTDPGVKFGWLTLPSLYRSAWIIDGQHRLYGFSRLSDQYLDQSLFVLAFEKLHVEKEADLFITINHKQKSVPRSLLISLLADIRMGDSDPSTALDALASAVVRNLNEEEGGPLCGRFPVPGVPPDAIQNLTMSEAVKGLRRSGLLGKVAGPSIAPGVLSGATDVATVDRASRVLSSYFGEVRNIAPDRWTKGKGGVVASNPVVRAHLTIISEVVSYLAHKRSLDFALMRESEFTRELVAFCEPLLLFTKEASDEEMIKKFSRKFGEGGVRECTYHLLEVLNRSYPDFGSEDFRRWIEQSNSEKIDEVDRFLMKLSERLVDYVIDTLKAVHGIHRLESDEPAFWEIGVGSERIRRNAFEKQQRDKERRKPKEAYLDIVDLVEIVKQKNNWDHFRHVFNNPQAGDSRGRKYYLDWINSFNELRNIAAHRNRLKTYSEADLEFVEWLRANVGPKVP